ncbi:MAG: ATP-grasp domain-containing protein [Polyangiaceae bacterium]|nr:ATP-grasp domain-containing protein [Polyangiaceae bacterium]
MIEARAVLCGDLNLVRCFAGTGVEITRAGCEPGEPAARSRYCRRSAVIGDALTEPARALDDLIALGRTLPDRPALLFDNDPTLLLVSRGRDALARYYRFLLPDAELVEDLASKVRFAALARRLDLPVPRTVVSHEVSSVHEVRDRLALPCMFKPISHAGWYSSEIVRKEGGGKPFKALLARTPEELARRWEDMTRACGDFVVQEHVAGGDHFIYSFHAYLDEGRRPLGYYVGRKIRTYPMGSGVSTYLELVKEPEVVRLGRDILERIGHVGAVKLDFKRDPGTGRFYLLEVNTRHNLWHHLGAACGINLPLIACMDLHGLAPQPATEYRTGVRWLSFGNDVRAFVRDYHPEAGLSWAEWLRSLRGEKVHDVFSWRDPLPAAAAAYQYVAARLRSAAAR